MSSSSLVLLDYVCVDVKAELCAFDDCAPRAAISLAGIEYNTDDTITARIKFIANKNCYKNIRYKLPNKDWVDAIDEYVYTKNGLNNQYWNFLTDQNATPIEEIGLLNVGTSGPPNYYGCYNLADNAPEITESVIAGHEPGLFANFSFQTRGWGWEAISKEAAAANAYANKSPITNISGGFSLHSGYAAGLRIASISNPANYSCFVEISDPGNTPALVDVLDYWNPNSGETIQHSVGGVAYTYKLQKFELTNREFLEFLNTCFRNSPDARIANTLTGTCECETAGFCNGATFNPQIKINVVGEPGDYVFSLMWDPAYGPDPEINADNLPARIPPLLAFELCNWLHNKVDDPTTVNTLTGAYDLTSLLPSPNCCENPAECPDTGFTVNPDTNIREPLIVRQPGARYFVPNDDELFKAVFYKGGGTNSGYWNYANGVDDPTDLEINQCSAPYGFIDPAGRLPMLRCADRDFNGLRFNCGDGGGTPGQSQDGLCEDCTNQIAVIENINPFDVVDGSVAAEICIKAFATDDCESNEICAPINIPPKPPVEIEFLTPIVTAVEGDNGETLMTFTVVRTGWLGGRTATLQWEVTGSGANPADADDFVGGVLPSGTITFGILEDRKNIVISIQGDTLPEPTEEFTVTLTVLEATPVTNLVGATAIGRILLDKPSIRFLHGTSSVAENSGSINIDIIKTGFLSKSCSATWTATPVGANPASADDFTDEVFPSGVVTFESGEFQKTINIPIFDDTLLEFNETFLITLSDPVNAVLDPALTSTTVTIEDDDIPPQLEFALPTYTAVENTQNVELVILKKTAYTGTCSVDWAVTPTGAQPVSAADFSGGVFPTGSVTFSPADSGQTIVIPFLDDLNFENNETFLVTLSNPVNAVLNPANNINAEVTILDDDSPATTNFIRHAAETDVTGFEGDSGSSFFSFEIVREIKPGSDPIVSEVDWELTFDQLINPIQPSDLALNQPLNGTIIFNENETSNTIIVEITGDHVVEPNEQFYIRLKTARNATRRGVPYRRGLVLNDDESTPAGSLMVHAVYQHLKNVPAGNLQQPCPDAVGSHTCSRATFILEIDGVAVGTVHHNNLRSLGSSDPDDLLNVTTGIFMSGSQFDRQTTFEMSDPALLAKINAGQRVSLRLRCAYPSCHYGISWIYIAAVDANGVESLIYNACVPNDQTIFIN